MLDAKAKIGTCIALTAVLAGACSSSKPPPPAAATPKPPPTEIRASLVAASNSNPDQTGRPSPIVVKVFELKTLASFQSGDFISVFEKESLGADLVEREQYTLVPGGQQSLSRKPKSDTRYIGIAAAFRDIDRAIWRASVAVPVNQTTVFTATIDGTRVRLTEQ